MRIVFRISKQEDASGKLRDVVFATIRAENNILKDINAIGLLSEYPNLRTAIDDIKEVFGGLKKVKKLEEIAFDVNTDIKSFSVTFYDKSKSSQALGQYRDGDLLDKGVTELAAMLLALKKIQAGENNREMFKKKLLTKKNK
jgi:hypothetical protein